MTPPPTHAALTAGVALDRVWRSPPSLPNVDVSPPPLVVALPNGDTTRLPGHTWPQLAYRSANHQSRYPLGGGLLVGMLEISKSEASDLLIEFAHPMHTPNAEHPAGLPYTRGWCFRGWALVVGGDAVGVVVSADPSAPVVDSTRGLHRRNTVDLARIARSPSERHEHCLRALLRLWREYAAPLYAEYRHVDHVTAAVTYSLPGKAGHIYRADGWRKIRSRKPSRGGGGWSKGSRVASLGDAGDELGTWLWEYPSPHEPPAIDNAPSQFELTAP